LLGAGLNLDPPNLSLPSSKDSRYQLLPCFFCYH
jgi:hypothetical protein